MPYKVMTNNDVDMYAIKHGGHSLKGKERQEHGLNQLEQEGYLLVGMGNTAVTKELTLYFHKPLT